MIQLQLAPTLSYLRVTLFLSQHHLSPISSSNLNPFQTPLYSLQVPSVLLATL